MNSAICKDEGVVAHVRGLKGFSVKAHDLVTELIVTHHEYAILLTFEGMENREGGGADVTEFR